jgi:hypothetical protein
VETPKKHPTLASERAANLEKEAAEARLELARIDPENLPINTMNVGFSIKIKGVFPSMNKAILELQPLPNHLDCVLELKRQGDSPPVIVKTFSYKSEPVGEPPYKREPGDIVPPVWNFTGSFVWPLPQEMGLRPDRIEAESLTTAGLMKELEAVTLTLPETSGPAEVLNGDVVIYVNGIIRKQIGSIPKTYEGKTLRCVPEKR